MPNCHRCVASLVTLVLWPNEPDRTRDRGMLTGDHPVQLVAPDDGAAYDATSGFAWSYPLAPGEQFEVVLVSRSAGGAPFEYTRITSEDRWLPNDELRATWPARATWSVRVLAGGEVRASSPPRAVSFE